ncbi:penicillin-binding protein activator [Novosphingobium colocasiae]|uniref:Leucine-binding protein domain-containing protein n=1 Tax=Novosphingobium colocasiae TaxID=1256513 RepID=A0A918PBU9_9SPHN|nr:penicillin-binding protein activator [Novosphingobium colocasiae]GGY97490.1 hypothetical protein GCM10011614_10640 [Novosphingobium colocasiae]
MFGASTFGGVMNTRLNRRNLVATLTLSLLGACSVVPKTTTTAPPPPPKPVETNVIASDTTRHRIALLVPTSGKGGDAGQSIANAANMALLDTSAGNLRISIYDTSAGAGAAAKRAIADGNRLILGPLLADDVPAVSAEARPAGVPVISFSNDEEAAGGKGVFVMGNLPGQSISRTVSYARSRGVSSFAALVPRGEYGDRVSSAFLQVARREGGTVVAMEPYDRSTGSIGSAVARVKAKGGFDALLIADSGSLSAKAAATYRAGGGTARLLGTELWSGERELTATPALSGAWFATVSDQRFGRFATSYRTRFGAQPFRIATLGYDAVLLTLRVARDWKPGTRFPIDSLTDSSAFPEGFLGVDGAFRFTKGGLIERALEVREVRKGTVATVSPAPATVAP